MFRSTSPLRLRASSPVNVWANRAARRCAPAAACPCFLHERFLSRRAAKHDSHGNALSLQSKLELIIPPHGNRR